MNILVVIHYPIFGGPHNRVLRMAPLLHEEGWRSFVAIPNEEGNAYNRLSGGACQVIPIRLHRLRNKVDPRWLIQFAASFPGDVQRIRRIIRTERIDLVLVAGLANPHGAVAAYLEGVPVAWQIIDSRTPVLLRKTLMSLVLRISDAVMFGGKALVDLHLGLKQVNLPIVVCPPAVDTDKFIPSVERRLATRVALGIPVSACVVGMVANINPQKGIEYFVRTASILAKRRPDTYFLVVGAFYKTQWEYSKRVQKEVEATGIPSDHFLFAGDQPDVENFYPAMDVKLITSLPRSEGTTTTAMEAMACSVPVVATDVGAVKEVVDDGFTGFIVPPCNPQALATATLKLLEDSAIRRRMGTRARERAINNFDIRVNLGRYLSTFQRALNHRRTKTAALFSTQEPVVDSPAFAARQLLRCPACGGSLDWETERVQCRSCDGIYPLSDGIPVLLIKYSNSSLNRQKEQQAGFFDHNVSADFEVTRPHGLPRIHRWLLTQKFLNSVRGLSDALAGVSALTVCGGSGMEAEFLARSGAHVVVSDISLGAARRARERAERFGLSLFPIVADAEHLPFADGAIHLVYVHDGLHHLESPLNGLREMTRVASTAVSVTEPARALITRVAIHLRIAERREESGNEVGRLRLKHVRKILEDNGFQILHAHRYGMYYSHVPGSASRVLSTPGLFNLTKLIWRVGNCVFGRFGNKLAVVGRRQPAEYPLS